MTPCGDNPVELGHITRFWLNDVITQVLCIGLGLLDVNVPERM